jgi:UDP-N-acetylglucosamine 2-epimerase (non-hydrolysing)
MIHLIIGTKAQLIKMYGVIDYFQKNNIEYNYIDTCQHPNISAQLRKTFAIKEPDFRIIDSKQTINSTFKGLNWIIKIFFLGIFKRKKIFKGDKNGICFVHGDTMTTILGAIIGKLGGQRIVHLEAGERSGKLFKPFPEELSRIMTDKISSYNFAFIKKDLDNVNRINPKAKNYYVQENTLLDTVEASREFNSSNKLPKEFILVSIHRYETIISKKRIKFIVDTINDFSKKHKVIWGLHSPTERALKKFNLYNDLKKNKNVTLREIFEYKEFINAISKSTFLMTDGGGPQEETAYLNIPCLIMRTELEIESHTHLHKSNFEKKEVDYFMKNLKNFKSNFTKPPSSPSMRIIEILKDEIEASQSSSS